MEDLERLLTASAAAETADADPAALAAAPAPAGDGDGRERGGSLGLTGRVLHARQRSGSAAVCRAETPADRWMLFVRPGAQTRLSACPSCLGSCVFVRLAVYHSPVYPLCFGVRLCLVAFPAVFPSVRLSVRPSVRPPVYPFVHDRLLYVYRQLFVVGGLSADLLLCSEFRPIWECRNSSVVELKLFVLCRGWQRHFYL